ncbi:MAG: hypothetical protein JWQ33_1081 [Ramlibacter sp.]|nr:hypothetical protein [Ramlibacter sp.]
MSHAEKDNPSPGAYSSDRPGSASGEGASSAFAAMIRKRDMGENESQRPEQPKPQDDSNPD